MHPLDALADPVRRALVERLAASDCTAGELVREVGEPLGLSQPAVSRHLRVLREHALVTSVADGPLRRYALRPDGFAEVIAWADRYRGLVDDTYWAQRLDALGTEIARGQPGRRMRTTDPTVSREDRTA